MLDHGLHVALLNGFVIALGDLPQRFHLLLGHSVCREERREAFQVLTHFKDLHHILRGDHGSVRASSRLDGDKPFLLELTDRFPDRRSADAHFLGELNLHHARSRYDGALEDLHFQFFIDHFPKGFMVLDIKIQHGMSLSINTLSSVAVINMLSSVCCRQYVVLVQKLSRLSFSISSQMLLDCLILSARP